MPARKPQPTARRLPRSFYTRDALTVARDLLGQRLVRIEDDGERTAGLIVEVEAYLGVPDKAAHTFGGRRTERNDAMYRIGGTAYVYFIYGVHDCINVVAGREGEPVAALLRALEPTEGIDRMIRRRPKAKRDRDLCSGPGKLCAALGITRQRYNGADLVTGDTLFIECARREPLPDDAVVATTRVGVDYAGEWAAKPYRFYLMDNPNVSRR